MRTSLLWFVPAFLPAFLGVCAAQTPNISGEWRLNVDKSQWGSAKRPLSVVLRIEHAEPVLKYTGWVEYTNEDTREFAFSGAIDGKPYPMARSFGNGNAVLRRIDPTTFEAVFRSNDGSYVETTRTTVGRNDRTLTRKVRLDTPEGKQSWTEIYDRR